MEKREKVHAVINFVYECVCTCIYEREVISV